MSKLSGRLDRIFKRTHVFVPRRCVETLETYHRLELAEVEKRPQLGERLKEIEKLESEIRSNSDASAADARLQAIFDSDPEARHASCLRFWENAPKTHLGTWLKIDTGRLILDAAKNAKLQIDRKKEKSEKQ